MRVQVSFDREDRCYQFDDEVTGSVAVEATSDVDCSEVAVTHGWGTHGRGYRDGLHERRILAAPNTSLREGESRIFPFRFRVPNGPVTYHGHYVNVDWYVTAHVRSRPGHVFNNEQDFLVLGGESSGAILLGAEEIKPEDIPARSTEPMSDSTSTVELPPGSPAKRWIVSAAKAILSFLSYIVVFALVLVGLSAFSSNSSWAVILIGIALALLWLRHVAPKAYRSISHSKLELHEIWLKPGMAYRGSPVHCHMNFSTKAAVHLRDIKVTMFAQERVTRPAGTLSATNYYSLPGRSFLRRFDEDLPAGRHFTFDYALPVEDDTPPTFSSKNNGLDWYVRVQVGLKGWPEMVETLPLTLLP